MGARRVSDQTRHLSKSSVDYTFPCPFNSVPSRGCRSTGEQQMKPYNTQRWVYRKGKHSSYTPTRKFLSLVVVVGRDIEYHSITEFTWSLYLDKLLDSLIRMAIDTRFISQFHICREILTMIPLCRFLWCTLTLIDGNIVIPLSNEI